MRHTISAPGIMVSAKDADLLRDYIWYWGGGRSKYLRRQPWIDGKQVCILFHRAIAERMIGRPLTRKDYVDHADHNTSNNTRENLRVGSAAFNIQNRQGAQRNNGTSTFRGVTWNKLNRNWNAQACVHGKHVFLGVFSSESEAAETARNYRLAHMPGALS